MHWQWVSSQQYGKLALSVDSLFHVLYYLNSYKQKFCLLQVSALLPLIFYQVSVSSNLLNHICNEVSGFFLVLSCVRRSDLKITFRYINVLL